MYQVISLLVLPPAVFIVSALIALLFRARAPRISTAILTISLVSLWLFSTAQIGERFLSSLETYPALNISEIDGAENAAIVVLSAGTNLSAPEYGNGATIGPLTLERLRYGAFLARQTGLPVLLSGGETDPGIGTLASLMEKSLRMDFNVPAKWLEEKSRTTYGNAVYSAEILKAQNIDRVYLVTHAWHMPRSITVFEATGLEIIAAPTSFTGDPALEAWTFFPGRKGVEASWYAAHEYLGRFWYWLKYGV